MDAKVNVSYKNLPDCGDQQCFFNQYRKGDVKITTNCGCNCTPDDLQKGFKMAHCANLAMAGKLKGMEERVIGERVWLLKSEWTYAKAIAAMQCMLIDRERGDADGTDWILNALEPVSDIEVDIGDTAEQHWKKMVCNEPESEEAYRLAAIDGLRSESEN